MTTFEVSNLGRYGFMGGRGGASLSAQMGHRHIASPTLEGDDGQMGSPAPTHHHNHGGCGSFIMQLTGLDVFTRGKAADGLARAGKASNPFDLGLIGNCKDFWSKGRELGVDYDRLYDIPPEGLREAKRRREREEDDDGRRSKSHFMGFNLNIGRGSRSGYEPVSQV